MKTVACVARATAGLRARAGGITLSPMRSPWLLGGAACGVTALVLVLTACATDNGDPLFGQTFGPPTNDGAAPPADGDVPVDAAGQPDAPPGSDGGSDSGSGCAGRVAVLAGDDTRLTAGQWSQAAGWSASAVAGGAASSPPSLAPFGQGFLGLTRGATGGGGPLGSVTLGATIGALEAVGGATTRGAPALAIAGADAHALYQSATFTMLHARRPGAAAWTGVDSPVGAPQSFGPVPPAAAAAGADVIMAFVGDAGGGTPPVFVQTLSGGAWGAASPVTGSAAYVSASPALASVPSAAVDLVLVWVDDATRRLTFSSRAQASKSWSAPAVVHTLATSNDAPAVVALSPTSLVVAFRGQDDRPYASFGVIAGTNVTFAPASAIVSDASVKVASRPSVAPGVCGDQAIAALASGGTVRAIRHRGGAWAAPETVAGAAGAHVAVATR